MEKKDAIPRAYLNYERQRKLRGKRLAEISKLDTVSAVYGLICIAVAIQSNHAIIYEQCNDRTNKMGR